MSAPSLMIFAAGFGTRMGDLTRTTPKPMLPLGGAPMIDRAIAMGRAAGVSRILANTHHQHDQIAPHLAAFGVEVLQETPDILDTGGGLKAARRHLTSPTFTLNPDVLWRGPNPLTTLHNAWHDGCEALLLIVPLARAVHRNGGGDFSLSDGQLTRGEDLVYTGAQLIRTEALADHNASAFSLNETWNRIADRGGLMGCIYPGTWVDIGTPDGLAAANKMVQADDV